jgi:hypothetical protein
MTPLSGRVTLFGPHVTLFACRVTPPVTPCVTPHSDTTSTHLVTP